MRSSAFGESSQRPLSCAYRSLYIRKSLQGALLANRLREENDSKLSVIAISKIQIDILNAVRRGTSASLNNRYQHVDNSIRNYINSSIRNYKFSDNGKRAAMCLLDKGSANRTVERRFRPAGIFGNLHNL